jgi:hypothetical protein
MFVLWNLHGACTKLHFCHLQEFEISKCLNGSVERANRRDLPIFLSCWREKEKKRYLRRGRQTSARRWQTTSSSLYVHQHCFLLIIWKKEVCLLMFTGLVRVSTAKLSWSGARRESKAKKEETPYTRSSGTQPCDRNSLSLTLLALCVCLYAPVRLAAYCSDCSIKSPSTFTITLLQHYNVKNDASTCPSHHDDSYARRPCVGPPSNY